MVRTLPLCYLARNLRGPSAQSPRRPVFSAYKEPRRLKYTGRLPLCAEGSRCTLGLLSRRSVRGSHIIVRVFPRRHRSIPPLEGFACRPVPLYHPTGRGVPNPASCPDSPTSSISPTRQHLHHHLHRNGRPGGDRTRTHPATSGSTVVPTYSDSHGAERYNSATCHLRSTPSGSFRGEKCH